MTLIDQYAERERRRAVVAQARATVARVSQDEAQRAVIDGLTARRFAGSDPMEAWRKSCEPFEEMRRERALAKERRLNAPPPRPDHSEIDARIASAVEVEREISADVLGEVVAEERASTAWKLGQEVKKLRAEIERMRAARETERAALRDEISSMRETHTR